MRDKHLILKFAVAAVVIPLMAGCATFHQAHVQQVRAEQAITHYQPPAPPPVVTVTNTPFLLGTVVDVRHAMPAVLRQPVTLVTSSPLSLSEIAAKISSMTGIPVSTDDVAQNSGAERSLPPLPGSGTTTGSLPSNAFLGSSVRHAITLNYYGPLAGLLDSVAAKNGVWWHFRNGRIVFFRTETKTFSIPALAWSTKATGSIVASSGSGGGMGSSESGMGGAMGGNIGGAGATTGVNPSMGSSVGGMGASGSAGGSSGTGSTSITNTSHVDVWKGLQKVAQTVAGKSAQVIANASTGSITVTGTPPQVRHVREWIQGLSRRLSQQVAITVHVYDVQITNEQNYGLNLSGAFQSLGKQYGISVAGVAPPTPVSGQAPFSMGANILNSATGAMGQWSGSQVAVQALATMGNVSQVFEQSAVTLNGQPAPIQVAQQVGYLASSSSTQTANVGTTSGLMPGTVTTGFTAMFLPRISGGRILLGMNMTISSLISIQTVSSGGNSIQVPSIASSTFQQSVSLKPGQTLLLTGFKQHNGQTTHNGVGSPYMPLLGGGADANTKNQMIAIVITARIL